MITAESCTLQEPTVLGSEKVTPKCGGPTAKPNGLVSPALSPVVINSQVVGGWEKIFS